MSKYQLKEPDNNQNNAYRNTSGDFQNPYAGGGYYNPQGQYGNGGYNPANRYGNGGYNPNSNTPYYDQFQQQMYQRYTQAERTEEEVRAVVGKSFLFMMCALLITAFSAFLTYSNTALFDQIFETGMFYLLIIAELAIVFGASHAISQQNTVLSAVLFVAYSIVNGMTLSCIFAIYLSGSIVNVFIISAVLFGVMALIGLTTDIDLTGIGSLCMVGLLGIIVAGVLNIFIFRSSQMDLIISVVGIIIFIGLTAYDAQKIKDIARENPQASTMVLGMYGALELYLDFINIFLKLLRLMGRQK